MPDGYTSNDTTRTTTCSPLNGTYTLDPGAAASISNFVNFASLKDRLNKYDFGLSIGASYPINKKLSAEFMFHRGIADLDPFSTTIPPFQVSSEFYTRALHFGLAYQLN